MTPIRPRTLARLAPLALLAVHIASAQTGAGQPEHPHDQSMPMDPSMHMDAPAKATPKTKQTDSSSQMDPSMKMDPSTQVNHSTHKKAPAKKSMQMQGKTMQMPSENSSDKPITEPTVAPSDNGEAMHMHMGKIKHVTPDLPDVGISKNPPTDKGPVYALEDFEQKAMAHNPTLAQARQDITAAQGIRRQSGFNPNPIISYYGDEIRGGAYRSGKQGFLIDQPIILGGKLGLNRKIEDQSVHQMEASSEAQKYRVRNATREAYYRVLTAQEMLNIKRQQADIAHNLTEYTHEIANTGQADETEVLRREVDEQHVLIAVGVEENMLRRAWTELASMIGEPALPMGTVRGDIEALPPELEEARLLNDLLAHSPAVQYAQAGVAKAEAALNRARRDVFPDLTAKGGVSQDNEPLFSPQSRVGLVGYAEIGLQVHLFDRNQGNIDAGRANLERARQDLSRVELSLRTSQAAVMDDYRNARLIATRYRDEILPRTERAYVLMTKQYGLMDASYPRVLNLQRELYETTEDYLKALQDAQTRYVVLDGFLYSGGLDSPGSADPSMSPNSGGAMPASGVGSSTSMSPSSNSGSSLR